jgi:hypothetical protein
MPRFALASLCATLCALFALAAEPEPTPVEKQLAIQTAMAEARKHLDARMPADAVAALEKEVAGADGNKAFLTLLREAYLADLHEQEKRPDADPQRLAQTKRKLALLGAEVPVAEKATGASQPPLAKPDDKPKVEDAVAAFRENKFAEADKLFTGLGAAKLTREQKTAWAYCRIKLGADRLNAPNCDATTAAGVAQDVADALELVTDNAKLLASGREVLKAATAKAKGAAPAADAKATGDAVETANFKVLHGGNRELGEAVAKAAEAGRKEIFERWSGPPSGAWQSKCQIAIHADAESYAKATGKPAALTGHATVTLANARVTQRRIDLRADEAIIANALPRELTHVVLADLFADKPPPKWALEGMAILAGSPEEISRYTRTLPRAARDGELRTLNTLFDLKDFPAEKITGYYCQSVSVTEYLIKLNGERNFKIFLGDAQRYGVAQALKRQYNIDGPQALEAAWKRACLEQPRAQAP